MKFCLWSCVLTLSFGWGLASLLTVECPTRMEDDGKVVFQVVHFAAHSFLLAYLSYIAV